MVQRQLVLPVPADELWSALTDPEEVDAWFGSSVEWELVPDGAARFSEGDGTVRAGRVLEVVPGARLRFRWWPSADEDDASEVTYTLEPLGEDTRLVVTEEPAAPSACAAWSPWDDRLLGVWAGAGALACAGRR